MFIYFTLL